MQPLPKGAILGNTQNPAHIFNQLAQTGRASGGRDFMKDHLELLNRFEIVARANFSKTTRIKDLCQLAGIAPRTLSRAFKKVHDKTPHRYFEEVRLDEARRALSSEGSHATITEVATRFGFRELGRFATLYKKQFDESPSETRRLLLEPGTEGSESRKSRS